MQRDDALRERITLALRGFAPQALAAPGQRTAAVALTIADAGHGADVDGLPALADWSGHAAMVLTRRAGTLTNHAGQWALPGGRIDPDESPEQAALRELREEVGLQLEHTAVLGRLDDFATRSGYVITPVVVWAGAARALTPNPGEVASIHRIPLVELLRDDAPLLQPEEGIEAPVMRMPIGRRWIAAPTGAFLYQFRELCLLGRPTRVSHFEQPGFAWK